MQFGFLFTRHRLGESLSIWAFSRHGIFYYHKCYLFLFFLTLFYYNYERDKITIAVYEVGFGLYYACSACG